ncbi:hypothetical protein O181_104447 [Austropuccinia psidii MF-1]|uniref:Uncharacterized protein n=1 Tax=Austropuccinia psidii MF-1 TaxID=1389203 RepID=A0A9Q3JLQ0_9BASI|nr:hypothetical protein [Austropuccinia psidii MF-1]
MLYLNQSEQLYHPPHLNQPSTNHPTKSPSSFWGYARSSPSGATPTHFNQGSKLEEKFKMFPDKYMKEYLTNTHSASQAEEEHQENKITEELTEDKNGFYVQEDIRDQMKLRSLLGENKLSLSMIQEHFYQRSVIYLFSLILNKPK